MDKLTKNQIAGLVRDQRWSSLLIFVEKFLKNYEDMPVKTDDQFNTVWNLAKKEGAIEGVRSLINELEKINYD